MSGNESQDTNQAISKKNGWRDGKRMGPAGKRCIALTVVDLLFHHITKFYFVKFRENSDVANTGVGNNVAPVHTHA